MNFQLFYPIKPHFINQAFGENQNPVYKQQGLLGHPGQDMKAIHGQSVYATHDGICYPQVDSHGGNGVVLLSLDHSYETISWHFILDNAVVQTGQTVKAGDLIGYADNTGESTGDHLHFGLRPYPIDSNNGYNGCIDPQPYFNGKYAQDINSPLPVATPYQFNAVIRLGAWSNAVKQLQITLKGQSLYTGAIDGIFGQKTLQAVLTFQLKHNLVSDGIVGAKTNAVLNILV